jgi:ABC-2 type transport system permease protein
MGVSVATVEPALRRGPGYWVGSYRALLAYDFASLRLTLLQTAFFQTLMGAGLAMTYGFFIGHLSPRVAQFVVTGTPTLALIPVGLVFLPAMVTQQRVSGSYDFTWSLPVPRSAAVASILSLIAAMAVPGAVVTLALSAWRYHVTLAPTLAIVPAVVLVALMCASVGYAMAHLISSPVVINLFSNALIFFVILFTPIAFPASQYPAWLVHVQEVLPLYPMAEVVRSGLAPGLVASVGRDYLVLVGWTVFAWAGVAWVVGRRS